MTEISNWANLMEMWHNFNQVVVLSDYDNDNSRVCVIAPRDSDAGLRNSTISRQQHACLVSVHVIAASQVTKVSQWQMITRPWPTSDLRR